MLGKWPGRLFSLVGRRRYIDPVNIPAPRRTPLGQTRTRVAADHAIVGPDSHVPSPLFGWRDTRGVILVSPAMGARHAMYLANLTGDSRTDAAPPGIERLVYVLGGEASLDGQPLAPESFAFLPAGSNYDLRCRGEAELLVFEKRYEPPPEDAPGLPELHVGKLSDRPAEPFLGDDEARLATLLPTTPAYDMAVNVFTYQSGAALPFVETHIMEHGLYMTAGQGVYRLGDHWYPVGGGDAIWMAAYCPQWFVAMGKQPARYVYYKDVHRNHLPASER